MSRQKITTMLGFATALFASAHAARAVIVSDFEAPTYTAGNNLIGVDNWNNGSNALVTSASTSPSTVLAGSQSVTFINFNVIWRQFGGSPDFNNGTTFSTLMRMDPTTTPTEYASFYISDNANGGSTPGGITMPSTASPATNTFRLEGLGGTSDSGVTFNLGDTYRLDMVVAFSDGVNPASYSAYATNLAGGGTTFLGTRSMSNIVTAAATSATGGVVLYVITNDGASFDNITYELAPEPASAALLALGGMLVIRRRRMA